jgi:sulfonate transport system ATP-binding protein
MALITEHRVAENGVPRKPVASVRGVSKSFGEGLVLDGLDLDIRAGEFVALLGRSGSGKSTLLRALAGLEGVQHGSVEVDGRISVAFQEPRLMPWKRVRANVELALEAPRSRGPEIRRSERAQQALDEVGLADKADVWPRTLSGGQAQRVSLARALAPEPGLLLLDEPFSALDALTRMDMHRLVLRLWERHRPGVLLVTHDVDEALVLADRVLVLVDGRIAHQQEVRAPRPRHTHHPEMTSRRVELLEALGVDPEIIEQEGAA